MLNHPYTYHAEVKITAHAESDTGSDRGPGNGTGSRGGVRPRRGAGHANGPALADPSAHRLPRSVRFALRLSFDSPTPFSMAVVRALCRLAGGDLLATGSSGGRRS